LRICSKPIDSFGWKCHKTAAAQSVDGFYQASFVGPKGLGVLNSHFDVAFWLLTS
jgi:hypothetical protein